MTEEIRLNKFLAACGVGSRRACDQLIEAGRVEVNGKPCVALGSRVSDRDAVRVDGKRVRRKSSVVLALNKPRGFVCSRNDELGRDTIYSLLPQRYGSLHHVGRLDLESEGLLVMTNDGDLTQRLMHPSRAVEKEYLVTADQAFQAEHLDQFLSGIHTPDGKLRAKALERISPRRLKVILDHGAKRQIRVMFEVLGYRVVKLIRVRIGDLWLGELQVGSHAVLEPSEVAMLTSERESKSRKTGGKKHPAATARRSPAKRSTQSPGSTSSPKKGSPRGGKSPAGRRSKGEAGQTRSRSGK